MKKLFLSLIALSLLSSCYDMKEHSLERSADYSEKQTELMQEQVDQLTRIADELYNYNNKSFWDTIVSNHSQLKSIKP